MLYQASDKVTASISQFNESENLFVQVFWQHESGDGDLSEFSQLHVHGDAKRRDVQRTKTNTDWQKKDYIQYNADKL